MKEILLSGLLDIVKYSVAVIIPVIGVLVGRLLQKLLDTINNNILKDLAIQAVLYVEDKLGADTGTGKKKLKLAVEWLTKKTNISEEYAEELIRVAYQNILAPFLEEKPL